MTSSTYAWENHQALSPALTKVSKEEDFKLLSRKIHCQDQTTLETVIQRLELNPKASYLPFEESCHREEGTSLQEMLLAGYIDEPDHGMDANLPSQADPKHDRKWMGGESGATSQGFRHMYFAGWRWTKAPLSTFQYPFHSLGQAVERVDTIAREARRTWKEGDQAWAARLFTWASHYIQDLTQPFHTVQLPSLKMIAKRPVFDLLFHPKRSFDEMTTGTTQIVTNYHWAYETYVHHFLTHHSELQVCLSEPERFTTLSLEVESPETLAKQVSDQSRKISSRFAKALIAFFGERLMDETFDITKNPFILDYEGYATRSDLTAERKRLHDFTCQALANSAVSTLLLMQWVYR